MAAGELNPIVSDVTSGPDLFLVLGIPLLKGRYFTAHENQNSAPVAIVSDGFARRFSPNQEAIGKRIKQSGPEIHNKWMEIVGMVGNVKYLGLTLDTDPAYYMPFAQTYSPRMFLAVRSSSDAARVAATLRRDIQAIDPAINLAELGTMDQDLALSISQPCFDTMLLALFAGIALLLAAVGIYGLVAYSVAQRTHQIGVRMAAGAAQPDVVRTVVAQGVSLAAIGIVIGLSGALRRICRDTLVKDDAIRCGRNGRADVCCGGVCIDARCSAGHVASRDSGGAHFPANGPAIRIALAPKAAHKPRTMTT